MKGSQADPEQTERLLFLSNQADDKFSVTINEFYASVRHQCQTTVAFHFFANGSLSPSQSNRLVVASQEATKNLQVRMRALYSSFEEQKDAKAKALSALALEYAFFKLNNALLLSESHDLIAQDNELQKLHRTTHSECEGLKKQVAGLNLERTNLLDRATTAEKQQNVLQVEIDHKTRQYNQSQTSVLGLEGQVRRLDRSLLVDRTKLEDEKRRSAELQTSVEHLQSNVETLEQALFQSNDCLKVHVAHVDTQQTTNDALKRQVQDLEDSLGSARKECDDSKRDAEEHQDAVMGLDLKMKELEQSLQSTEKRLENEKSLSNAGQASMATLTMKVHQLENSLGKALQEGIHKNDRHAAHQQNLERSLSLSNNSLEAYMNLCKSQQASIDSLNHEVQRLKNSLEVAHKALEDERERSVFRQASIEELGATAKELEAPLHLSRDCLKDERIGCKMHQVSIASLTANVHDLEQSLHVANADLEKHKQQNQDLIVSTEADVQKLEKTLQLTRSDLGDKRARCIVQAASIAGLNGKLQAIRGDLVKSQRRCNAQQLSIISLSNTKQELEKSLQASRDDLEVKTQLYSTQQPYIDSLKETERKLQQSLESSRTETRIERERCTTQQSWNAEMEKKLQKLNVELELTRGQLDCAKQSKSTRNDGESEYIMDMQQLGDGVASDAAGEDQPASTKSDIKLDGNPPKANTARKRHNGDDFELESQRKTKRHHVTSTADVIVRTLNDNRGLSELAGENGVEEQQHVPGPATNIEKAVTTQDLHMPEKLAYLEQIRCSPWARDASEDTQHFVDSLTPALCVNVLSRLAKLSKDHSTQQVVLQINLKQLDRMPLLCGDLNGSSTITPTVEHGFTITERHVRAFTTLSFDKARLDKLLDFRLNRVRFGPEPDVKTLGFTPSGLLTLNLRRDSPTTARTLRERFDAETIATMQVTRTEPYGNVKSPHSRAHPEQASDHHAQHIQARRNSDDQDDGSSRVKSNQSLSKQHDRPQGQTQTETLVTAFNSGSGSGRAQANDQRSNASEIVHNNFADTEHPRNAAVISNAQRTVRSRGKNKPPQVTAGANGRPKRTPKPSRRATEAASAKRR